MAAYATITVRRPFWAVVLPRKNSEKKSNICSRALFKIDVGTFDGIDNTVLGCSLYIPIPVGNKYTVKSGLAKKSTLNSLILPGNCLQNLTY